MLLHQSDSGPVVSCCQHVCEDDIKITGLVPTLTTPGNCLAPASDPTSCAVTAVRRAGCALINGVPPIPAHGPHGLASESPSCELDSAARSAPSPQLPLGDEGNPMTEAGQMRAVREECILQRETMASGRKCHTGQTCHPHISQPCCSLNKGEAGSFKRRSE